MRVNLHDYSGHPFQVQLARYLAGQGHEVVHNYCTDYVTGHGRLEVGPDDPSTLRIEGVSAGVPMIKYNPLGRTRFELRYAAAWQEALEAEKFDVVVACNVPLFALARMRRYFQATGQRWLLWHQDIYSRGVAAEARIRFSPLLADAVRFGVERIERAQVRSADGVVPIDARFVDQYRHWGLSPRRCQVIPNWAPVDDIVPGERDNAWAREQGLPEDALRLLYAGTLGRKHNPMLLVDMLDGVGERGARAHLTVISQGEGADLLRRATAGRTDVLVLDYQPAERLGQVLASADAHVALLEPDASQFSVPSKVLTSFSSGRVVIGLMPGSNPAAEDILTAGGYVAPPTQDGADDAAKWLVATASDPLQLEQLHLQARGHAVAQFDIGRIGARFEDLLGDVTGYEPLSAPPLIVQSEG